MSNIKSSRTLLPPSITAATAQPPSGDSVAGELIVGATAIKTWLGLDTEQQLYNMRHRTQIPVFPMPGRGLVARKSELRRWIERMEREDLERRTKRAGRRR